MASHPDEYLLKGDPQVELLLWQEGEEENWATGKPLQ